MLMIVQTGYCDYKGIVRPTLSIMKSGLKRAGKSLTAIQAKYPKNTFEVMTSAEYHARDYDVEVINLLSEKPCKIKFSQVGTCCDPSTERYHCM